MTALALDLRHAPLSAESLKTLLDTLGASIGIRDTVDEIIARWPVRSARVAHDERRVAVFRMNERGEWRGVLMVGGDTPHAYELVAQEAHFRDVLHVALWLSRSDPKGRTAALSFSPVLH